MYGYTPHQAPAANRIIKRPMTEAERGFVVNHLRNLQKAMRILAVVPILILVISLFLGNTLISILMTFMIVILFIVNMGMTGYILDFRNKMSHVLKDGTAIEVQGLAYGSQTSQNRRSFTVGPISLTVTLEDSRLFNEGAQVSVLCVPKLKIALSVNNIGFKNGASLRCPPNLEAMAEPMHQSAQLPVTQQPQYYQPALQPNQPYEYPPPPPPGWSPPQP